MSYSKSKVRSSIFVSAAAFGAVIVAPNIAEASFGENTLRFGMEDEEVKVLQEKLKDEGYFTFHTATGYFGEITRTAVKSFQKEHRLSQDGIVGPQTFSVLNGNRSSTNSSTSSNKKESSNNESSADTYTESGTSSSLSKISNTSQVMRNGTRNGDVSRLQAYLKKAGFYEHPEITGIYGNMTQQAVRKFQQARGLTVDGLAGPNTFTMVNKEISGTSPTKSTEASSSAPENNSSETVSNNSGSSDLSGVVLRQGARGKQVEQLQKKLKDLGFYTSSIDGSYGPLTAEAVRKVQRQASISVDGVFGPQTYKQLNKGESSNSSNGSSNGSSNSSSSSSALKEGSQGSNVTELQNMLRATGHFNQQPTGYFGSVTKEAVKKFQSQWDLVSDGIATTSTLNKLEEVAAIHMSESSSNSGSKQSFDVMNLVADASNYIGVPYLWGGTTASGFDCSGFIQHVFRNNGVNIPRTVAQQWNAGTSVSTPKVGDVVFFETYKSGPSHNGIYIGNNKFVHSGSSTGVTTTSMSNSYWAPRYLGAKRMN
ncbi:peptidoglycan-binding protein [Salipaludibacillus sp. HK11]|uniref:C40 family peptidase n=1 Tax=Salipaludibacillus sp. HK11 TaxID=3394320 RepID=UPI0039FD4963